MPMLTYERPCPSCKKGFLTMWSNPYSFFDTSADRLRATKEEGDREKTFCSNALCNWKDVVEKNKKFTRYFRLNIKQEWSEVD